MREWHTRGEARTSHFVAARLLPRVLHAFLAFLAARNGELALRILYSWHFLWYISNDIHEQNVSLVDDYCLS